MLLLTLIFSAMCYLHSVMYLHELLLQLLITLENELYGLQYKSAMGITTVLILEKRKKQFAEALVSHGGLEPHFLPSLCSIMLQPAFLVYIYPGQLPFEGAFPQTHVRIP